MSRVKVILNYVDVACAIRDIKKAETFVDVVDKANKLEKLLEDAANQKEAEFLND